METISYEYEGSLYVNLTNRCDCACVFCLRHNGHKLHLRRRPVAGA